MKEQQTAPLTTEELTEKYHKLRRTFILATVISIFGTIVMLPSVLFFPTRSRVRWCCSPENPCVTGSKRRCARLRRGSSPPAS